MIRPGWAGGKGRFRAYGCFVVGGQSQRVPLAVSFLLHLLKDNDPRLVSAAAIIVYSGDPNDRLSTAATKKLLRYKFLVFEFRGGLAEWNRTRNPKPEPEPASSPKP